MYPDNIGTRYMTIKLILDEGVYPSSMQGGTGSNVKIITCNSDVNSLTAEVTITKATGFMDCSAYVTIYGLTIDDINAFSRHNVSYASQIPANRIEIYAGYEVDDAGIPPFAYSGQIRRAGANLNDPSRPFVIVSQVGITNQNTISPSTSFAGTVSLNTMFESMAKQVNPPLVYQGYNINGTALNPNYYGGIGEQIKQAAADHGCTTRIDGDKLYVTKVGQPFSDLVYDISAQNGMLGYPAVTEFGIDVRCRYTPAINFGQKIHVTSQLLIANGDWYINGMMTVLQNRGAKWETVLKLNTYAFNIEA
jgi:hypothetical protein